MPTNLQSRLSPKLALYGIAFRVLRGVALWPNGRLRTSEPAQSRPRRQTASLELGTARSNSLRPPVAKQ